MRIADIHVMWIDLKTTRHDDQNTYVHRHRHDRARAHTHVAEDAAGRQSVNADADAALAIRRHARTTISIGISVTIAALVLLAFLAAIVSVALQPKRVSFNLSPRLNLNLNCNLYLNRNFNHNPSYYKSASAPLPSYPQDKAISRLFRIGYSPHLEMLSIIGAFHASNLSRLALYSKSRPFLKRHKELLKTIVRSNVRRLSKHRWSLPKLAVATPAVAAPMVWIGAELRFVSIVRRRVRIATSWVSASPHLKIRGQCSTTVYYGSLRFVFVDEQ
ncbi:hypothetical protein F5Y10DRAFT_265384 [Nemania abortiva]|nr:hypothetical protein F5Y10DRAFT_265384 [Nemania abortiva]